MVTSVAITCSAKIYVFGNEMLPTVKTAVKKLDNIHLLTDINDLPKLTFCNELYCIAIDSMQNCLQEKQPNYGWYRKFEKKKF